VVLARDGGALARMLPVFNIFFGGPLGTGQQWFSWIHRCAAQASSYSYCHNAFPHGGPSRDRLAEILAVFRGFSQSWCVASAGFLWMCSSDTMLNSLPLQFWQFAVHLLATGFI
jgi:hypothetical protein